MVGLRPETVMEIAEKFADLNRLIVFDDGEKAETLQNIDCFDNATLVNFLQRKEGLVQKYIFKPKGRGFFVYFENGEFCASSYASRRETRRILDEINRLIYNENFHKESTASSSY